MSHQKKNRIEVDLHFEGFNFTGGLIVLAALKLELRVAVSLSKPPDRDWLPELSQLYPGSVSQTRRSLADLQFLMRCSSLFPHLYFPKRVLLFHSTGKLNPGLTTVFDQLAGRDRDMATLPVNTKKLKAYSGMDDRWKHGNLVFEYQFDRNGAIRELFWQCIDNGLMVISNPADCLANHRLKLLPFQHNAIMKKVHMDYPYPNPIRIKKPAFELMLNPQLSGVILQLTLKRKMKESILLTDAIGKLFGELNLNLPDEIIVWLNEVQQLGLADHRPEEGIADSPLKSLRTAVGEIRQQLNRQYNIKIDFKTIFTSYPANAITGETFRMLQNECDEQFDLAKQTGIDYREFSRLFYRYRFQIDEMIESAYASMTHQRDPQLIWQQAESKIIQNEATRLNKVSR